MWLLPSFLVILVIPLALLIFIIVTEGRYFGKRFLRRLYNLRAGTFELRDDWDQWRLLIRRLDISPTEHLLDLGTQTGHLPRLVANQAGFQGSVVGIDWSEEMIREAQRQSQLEGTSKSIKFLCADVQQPLHFPDDSFTLVVCATGLLDGLRNPGPIFEEVSRVLQSGGRFAFSYAPGALKAPGVCPQALEILLKDNGFSTPRSIPWLTTRTLLLSTLQRK
jgi:SAM-dependent methyltransferase